MTRCTSTGQRPLLGGSLAILTIVLLGIVPAKGLAHCAGKHGPSHDHCQPDPPPVDRIGGCVVFDAGHAIGGDAGGDYEDGLPVLDARGKPDFMQVAMNCSFNQFNVYPGGGDRRIRVDLAQALPSAALETGISKCDPATDPVNFESTDDFDIVGGGNNPPCSESGHDGWGFDQLMRSADSPVNVCDLRFTGGTSTTFATLRFQTNLHRRTTCKGGNNKCGDRVEGIEVNYSDDTTCAAVEISCTGGDASACTEWEIEPAAVPVPTGCLTHDNGGSPLELVLPFKATFTPGPCPDAAP